MIVETVFSWACTFFQGLFSLFQIVDLPVNFIDVLLDILCYGVWVVGADLIAIILSNVVFWLTLKYQIGLIVWLWRLLPFT